MRADEKCGNRTEISIHAPRTGSDRHRAPLRGFRADFNPRSPHGERPWCAKNAPSCVEFQSTLPARGATHQAAYQHETAGFQSTLPARGATHFSRFPAPAVLFQSTLPARGATFCADIHGCLKRFQSTLPARGATFLTALSVSPSFDFNPRSPHGERPDGV